MKKHIGWAIRHLSRSGIPGPRAEAEILLADLLGSDRIRLYTNYDDGIDTEVLRSFVKRIRERGRYKPIAQIVGYREFYGRNFLVNSHVLIPRPETEELVEEALRDGIAPSGRVLDLGCGTGCIGLTVLCEREDLEVHLSDISPQALKVAEENARNLCTGRGSPIFHHSDLFEKIPPLLFDAILSNPPYIHPDESESLMPDVRDYEPEGALFHPDPEALYLRIIREAHPRLKEEGLLILELSSRWAESALRQALELYRSGGIHKDLSGNIRFLFAKK